MPVDLQKARARLVEQLSVVRVRAAIHLDQRDIGEGDPRLAAEVLTEGNTESGVLAVAKTVKIPPTRHEHVASNHERACKELGC